MTIHDCWEHFGIGIINVISWNKNVFNVELFPNFPYMYRYLVLSYNAMKENANLCVLERKTKELTVN